MHGEYPVLEGGDLLIITGDITSNDSVKAWNSFYNWLKPQNYKKIVYIAGNHDNTATQFCTTQQAKELDAFDVDDRIEYLCDNECTFDGLRIWGTPWTAWFSGINPHCKAFTTSECGLKKKFAKIPEGIDIIVSHGPFLYMNDANCDGYACGSKAMRDTVDRVQPRFFICSHIHEQGGRQMMYKHQGPNTWCVNCSIMNENYDAVHAPVRIVI
jgi:Icc-related predicted phosphoesterase